MAIIASYTKQPADRIDYDIDYSEWLTSPDTVVSSVAAILPVGLTVDSFAALPVIGGNRLKLWVSGGSDGVKYKITVTTTTDIGRIKQDEVVVTVKDI